MKTIYCILLVILMMTIQFLEIKSEEDSNLDEKTKKLMKIYEYVKDMYSPWCGSSPSKDSPSYEYWKREDEMITNRIREAKKGLKELCENDPSYYDVIFDCITDVFELTYFFDKDNKTRSVISDILGENYVLGLLAHSKHPRFREFLERYFKGEFKEIERLRGLKVQFVHCLILYDDDSVYGLIRETFDKIINNQSYEHFLIEGWVEDNLSICCHFSRDIIRVVLEQSGITRGYELKNRDKYYNLVIEWYDKIIKKYESLGNSEMAETLKEWKENFIRGYEELERNKRKKHNIEVYEKEKKKSLKNNIKEGNELNIDGKVSNISKSDKNIEDSSFTSWKIIVVAGIVIIAIFLIYKFFIRR